MKKRSNLNVMMRLVSLVRPLIGFMVLAITMGLAGNLCATFITILGGCAILSVMGFSVPVSVTAAFVLAVCFALARGFLRYGEQDCNHFIAFKLLALIRDKVFAALRKLSPAKLEGRDKGDLINMITSDVELLEVFYAHTISPVVIAVLFSVIMCGFIGSFHWILGIAALIAYLSVGVVVPIVTSKLSKDTGTQVRTQSGVLAGFLLDSLRGISETIQYGQGQKRLSEIFLHTNILSDAQQEMKKTEGTNAAVSDAVIYFFDLVMLFAGIVLYQMEMISFPGFILSLIALMSSFGPVSALAGLGSSLQSTFAAGNRVLDILDEEPVVKEVTGEKEVTFSGAAADHVTFAYDTEKILKDVSVKIPEHQVIGIVGKSGSGKSTLLKLFMRFYPVQKGEITISKTPVSRINTDNLRGMEGFMTQETVLFHDSIANNLRIAKLDATREEMEEACKKASIHDFIMSLPDGYDTKVGELGDTLSGGEQQRIGLARAFLHNAPFMLLDEPTSNLDSLNEAEILKSINEEREGKTVILVSHRRSTMRIADKVYSVENGRVS